MNEQWQQISEYIDARSLRERIILLLVVIALVFFIVDFIWLGPAIEKRQKLKGNLENLQQSNATAQLELDALQGALVQKNASDEAQRQALRQRLTTLDEQLSSTASGFIPAELMPEVLENMLDEHRDLSLVSIENVAPQVMTAEGGQDNPGETQLYQHGVTLKLSGGYHAVLDYLAKLETMPWHFHWQSLLYEVEQYPDGVLTLELYTYSTDKEWLGV